MQRSTRVHACLWVILGTDGKSLSALIPQLGFGINDAPKPSGAQDCFRGLLLAVRPGSRMTRKRGTATASKNMPIKDEHAPERGDCKSAQASQKYPDALKTLVRLGLAAIGANQGALLVMDESRNVLRFAFLVSRNGLERHGRAFERLVGQEVPIGEGITGLAASERKAQYARIADNGKFHRVSGDGEPSAVLAVPMLCEGGLYGTMTAISFDRDRAFAEEDAQLYGQYADVAAHVVRMEAASNMWRVA